MGCGFKGLGDSKPFFILITFRVLFVAGFHGTPLQGVFLSIQYLKDATPLGDVLFALRSMGSQSAERNSNRKEGLTRFVSD